MAFLPDGFSVERVADTGLTGNVAELAIAQVSVQLVLAFHGLSFAETFNKITTAYIEVYVSIFIIIQENSSTTNRFNEIRKFLVTYTMSEINAGWLRNV